MQFRKIKHRDGKTELRWITRVEATGDETTSELTSTQDPEPEFPAALQALKVDVLKLLELPDDYGEGMSVSSVSISYSDDDRMGAVVTCLKQLEDANAPLVLNTPHLPEPDMDDPNPCMPVEMQARVDTLVRHAKRFARGRRAQQDMFDGTEREEAVLDQVEDVASEMDAESRRGDLALV